MITNDVVNESARGFERHNTIYFYELTTLLIEVVNRLVIGRKIRKRLLKKKRK
jgi:hypothetical protein